MKIVKSDLSKASEKGILRGDQVDPLWAFLEGKEGSFKGQLLYYLGGVVAVGGMVCFMEVGNKILSDILLALSSLIFALIFWGFGYQFWVKRKLYSLGSFFAIAAVLAVPFIIYHLEKGWGVWGGGDYSGLYWIRDGGWIPLELGLIGAALATVRFIPAPLLMLPLLSGVWLLSIDLTELWIQDETHFFLAWQWVSLVLGVLFLLTGYFVDRKKRGDFALWIYLFSLMSIDVGLTLLWGKGEGILLLFPLVSVGLMGLSLLLKRKIFLFVGGLNLIGYLAHLSYTFFNNPLLFIFSLMVVGFLTILTGVFWSKKKQS